MQAEARRFLSALGRRAAQSGNSFSVHQLFDLSDHLQLKVSDMRLFIDQLNEAGMFLCNHHNLLYVIAAGCFQGMTAIALARVWWTSTHVCLGYTVSSAIPFHVQVSC